MTNSTDDALTGESPLGDLIGLRLSTANAPGNLDSLLKADEAWNAAYHYHDPARLAPLLADDWLGFTPDGTVVFKEHVIEGMKQQPRALLVFERHACRVCGDTGFTRGTLYVNGERIQSFLRVYTWKGGQWWGVAVQVVG